MRREERGRGKGGGGETEGGHPATGSDPPTAADGLSHTSANPRCTGPLAATGSTGEIRRARRRCRRALGIGRSSQQGPGGGGGGGGACPNNPARPNDQGTQVRIEAGCGRPRQRQRHARLVPWSPSCPTRGLFPSSYVPVSASLTASPPPTPTHPNTNTHSGTMATKEGAAAAVPRKTKRCVRACVRVCSLVVGSVGPLGGQWCGASHVYHPHVCPATHSSPPRPNPPLTHSALLNPPNNTPHPHTQRQGHPGAAPVHLPRRVLEPDRGPLAGVHLGGEPLPLPGLLPHG